MLTGFFVLTLNLRIIIKTRWKTLSGLTQPAVVKLLHRTPAPTRSPASLQPPPSFLLSHKRSCFLSQGLCDPCRPAWNILPPSFNLPGCPRRGLQDHYLAEVTSTCLRNPQVIFHILALFSFLHGAVFPHDLKLL